MRLILLVFLAAASSATAQQPASTSAKEATAKGSLGKFFFSGEVPKVKVDLDPPAPPANSTTYTYDALGRLVQSDVTTDGATVRTKIDYDPAGNRTSYTVTGASRTGDDTGDGAAVTRPTGVVVVPLNGFTIIPLDADS